MAKYATDNAEKTNGADAMSEDDSSYSDLSDGEQDDGGFFPS